MYWIRFLQMQTSLPTVQKAHWPEMAFHYKYFIFYLHKLFNTDCCATLNLLVIISIDILHIPVLFIFENILLSKFPCSA